MAVWMGLLLAGALLAAADLDPSAQDPPSSSDDFKGLTESVTGRLILPNSLALGPPRPEHTELSRELLTDSICRKTPAAVDEICTARSVSEMPELPLCKGPVRDRLCRRRPRQLSQTLETASAAEVTEAGAACKGMGYSPCRFHSVQHEDAVLFNAFFKDRVGGVFIESGASTQADNTQFYEDTMQWTGVLVEASPTNYKALEKKRGGKDGTKLVNSAICSEERVIKFADAGDTSGVLDTLTASAIKSWGLDRNPPVEVPCRRMTAILRDAGIVRVDLWVLDVEGAELDVLRSHDFGANPVHVLVIERNVNDLVIESLLLEKGFTYWREQRGNRIFVNQGFTA